jgi:hypothetical protein
MWRPPCTWDPFLEVRGVTNGRFPYKNLTIHNPQQHINHYATQIEEFACILFKKIHLGVLELMTKRKVIRTSCSNPSYCMTSNLHVVCCCQAMITVDKINNCRITWCSSLNRASHLYHGPLHIWQLCSLQEYKRTTFCTSARSPSLPKTFYSPTILSLLSSLNDSKLTLKGHMLSRYHTQNVFSNSF